MNNSHEVRIQQEYEQQSALKQELVSQVLQPLSPDDVVVDASCTSWPYYVRLGSHNYRWSSREFGEATFVAIDAGIENEGFKTGNELQDSAKHAADHGIKVDVVQGKRAKIPLEDQSASEVFYGSNSVNFFGIAQIDEAQRVLRDGGMLVVKESFGRGSMPDLKKLKPDSKYAMDRHKEGLTSHIADTLIRGGGFDVQMIRSDDPEDSDALMQLESIFQTTILAGFSRTYILARKNPEVQPFKYTEVKKGKLSRLLGRKAITQ